MPALKAACVVTADEGRELARLEGEVAAKAHALETLQAQTAGLQTQIDALKASLEALGGDQVKAQKAALEAVATQVQETSSKISKARVQLSGAEKAIPKLERAVAEAEGELESAKRDADATEEQLAQAMEAGKAERTQCAELEATATRLLNAAKKASREHDAAAKAISELRSQGVALRNELEDLRQQLSGFEANNGKLAQKVAAEARKKRDLWVAAHPVIGGDDGN